MEHSFFRICSLLSHCNKNGMVFSPDKFMFSKETVECRASRFGVP
jgi:hypothetical protein